MSPFYNQSLEFLQCSTEEMAGFQPSSVTKLLYKHLEELINNPNELTKKMDLYLLKSAHKLVRDQCNSVFKYSNIFNENKMCLDFLKIEPKPVSISDYNPTLFSLSNNSISTTEDKTQLEIFPLTNNMYFELNKATLLLSLYVNKKKEVGLYIYQNTYQKIQSYLNDLPGLVSYLKGTGVTGNTMAEMIESNEKTRTPPSTLF